MFLNLGNEQLLTHYVLMKNKSQDFLRLFGSGLSLLCSKFTLIEKEY